MQEKYLVSVIIPVYNSSIYLKDILNDTINQTYKDLQIIIIDDGSVDDSVKIANDYAKKDNRIEVYSYKNNGQSRARNIGLSFAKGQYIRFFDSDDRVPLDSIEKMIQAMEALSGADMVIGNFISDSPYGIYSGGNLENQVISEIEFADFFVKSPRAFYYGAPWNKLYCTEIIKSANIYFDENISWCEDLLFNLEYYKHCKKVAILNCEGGIYQYFIRDTGVTGKIKQDKQEEARIEEFRYQELLKYFENYNLQEEFQLGWKYINFYYRLTKCVKKDVGRESVKERYILFSKMLKAEDAYHYICMRECDYDPRISKMLKRAIEKKHIFRVFLFFLFKSWLSAHFGKIMSKLRKCVGLRIPTDY